MSTQPRGIKFLFVCFSSLNPTAPAQELLSYWNFNKVESGYSENRVLGTFKTSPAGYGEGYDSSKRQLSSNNGIGAAFSGENIYSDLSQLTEEIGGSASSNWVVFADTGKNRALYDNSHNESEGRSFRITSLANADNHITITLSSRGHDWLVFPAPAGRSPTATEKT